MVSRQPICSTVPSMSRSGERIQSPMVNGPVEVEHQAAEKICQQILGREADGDAADAAEGEHAGDAIAERLQRHQHRGDDHGKPEQLGQRVQGSAVVVFTLFFLALDDVLLRMLDEAHQKPGQYGDDADIANRPDRGENRRLLGFLDDLDGEGQADDPDQRGEGFLQRGDDGIVPGIACGFELARKAAEQPFLDEVHQQGKKDDDEYLGYPGLETQRGEERVECRF
jgi:hypothetical protein